MALYLCPLFRTMLFAISFVQQFATACFRVHVKANISSTIGMKHSLTVTKITLHQKSKNTNHDIVMETWEKRKDETVNWRKLEKKERKTQSIEAELTDKYTYTPLCRPHISESRYSKRQFPSKHSPTIQLHKNSTRQKQICDKCFLNHNDPKKKKTFKSARST